MERHSFNNRWNTKPPSPQRQEGLVPQVWSNGHEKWLPGEAFWRLQVVQIRGGKEHQGSVCRTVNPKPYKQQGFCVGEGIPYVETLAASGLSVKVFSGGTHKFVPLSTA